MRRYHLLTPEKVHARKLKCALSIFGDSHILVMSRKFPKQIRNRVSVIAFPIMHITLLRATE